MTQRIFQRAGGDNGERKRNEAALSELAYHLFAQVISLRRMAQCRLGEAERQRDVERHRCDITRHNGAQDRRLNAVPLRHIDHELGAGPQSSVMVPTMPAAQ